MSLLARFDHDTYAVPAYPFGSRAACSCGWESWRTYPGPDLTEAAGRDHTARRAARSLRRFLAGRGNSGTP